MALPITPGNLNSTPDGRANSWTRSNAAEMYIRQPPDYATNKLKGPSQPEIYELFAADAFRTQSKVFHFGRFVNLPDEGTWDGLGIPPILILNIMLPSYGPSLVGGPNDGPGWTAIFYARLSDSARKQLSEGRPGPGLKLLREFMFAPEDSPVKKRFKCIAKALNPDEVNFSSATRALVKKYNGTPFLARTTTSFFHTERYFEIDLDVHSFGKPARMGVYGCSSVIKEIVFDWAFVVEGVEDEELPERLLTCIRLVRMDPETVPDLPFTPPPIS